MCRVFISLLAFVPWSLALNIPVSGVGCPAFQDACCTSLAGYYKSAVFTMSPHVLSLINKHYRTLRTGGRRFLYQDGNIICYAQMTYSNSAFQASRYYCLQTQHQNELIFTTFDANVRNNNATCAIGAQWDEGNWNIESLHGGMRFHWHGSCEEWHKALIDRHWD